MPDDTGAVGNGSDCEAPANLGATVIFSRRVLSKWRRLGVSSIGNTPSLSVAGAGPSLRRGCDLSGGAACLDGSRPKFHMG